MDPQTYIDGAKRMTGEGLESASKIMAFIKSREEHFQSLDGAQRKKEILAFEPSKLFNQIHPVVFHYLAVEGMFHEKAFRRYIKAVFGTPRSKEDEEYMRKDRRHVYHFKNRQQAVYYKFMLLETNPRVKIQTIHDMYEEVVSQLNQDTDNMLDAYERAEEASKIRETEITDEKRKDLLKILKQQIRQ